MEEFRHRLAEAGWRVFRADEGYGFGSWSIELEWGWRVEYNGRDERLERHRETSRDNWRKAWTAADPKDQTPAALLHALRRVKPAS
jgi:hypothetical protein